MMMVAFAAARAIERRVLCRRGRERAGQQRSFRDAAQDAQRPPDADDRGDKRAGRAGRQRGRGHMQAERAGADGTRPPGAKAGHHARRVTDGAAHANERAAQCQHNGFGKKQPPDHGGGEPDGSKQADFPGALLDAETEEQRRHHQRRNDQEEAEIGEVFAEVGGAARGGQAAGAHIADGDGERQRIDARAQLRGKTVRVRAAVSAGRSMQAHRRAIAETRSPQSPADVQGDERLRRCPVFVPVVLVYPAHAFEIDGKRRIPVAKGARLRDPGIHRREPAIGGGAFDRHHGRHLKPGDARDEPPRLFPDVIIQREEIAGADRQVACGPGVQHDGRRIGRGIDYGLRCNGPDVSRRDQRVRDLTLVVLNGIGEIC